MIGPVASPPHLKTICFSEFQVCPSATETKRDVAEGGKSCVRVVRWKIWIKKWSTHSVLMVPHSHTCMEEGEEEVCIMEWYWSG